MSGSTRSARRGPETPVHRSPPTREAVRRAAAFREALRRFERHSERIAREHGLTPQRYLLLLMVKGSDHERERATVGELATRMQLARHTVTELVDRAEGAGLVRRRRSPTDGRVVDVHLTDEGERLLAATFVDHASERGAHADALDGGRREVSPVPASREGAPPRRRPQHRER